MAIQNWDVNWSINRLRVHFICCWKVPCHILYRKKILAQDIFVSPTCRWITLICVCLNQEQYDRYLNACPKSQHANKTSDIHLHFACHFLLIWFKQNKHCVFRATYCYSILHHSHGEFTGGAQLWIDQVTWAEPDCHCTIAQNLPPMPLPPVNNVVCLTWSRNSSPFFEKKTCQMGIFQRRHR